MPANKMYHYFLIVTSGGRLQRVFASVCFPGEIFVCCKLMLDFSVPAEEEVTLFFSHTLESNILKKKRSESSAGVFSLLCRPTEPNGPEPGWQHNCWR